jgi:Tol biopolymer transport system component
MVCPALFTSDPAAVLQHALVVGGGVATLLAALDRPVTGPPSPCAPTVLDAGTLATVVDDTWLRSQTFRAQCARLATSSRLRVRIVLEVSHRHGGPRASTRIVESRAGVSADVVIRDVTDTVELIAHELEHVVEHLDGAIRVRCDGAVSRGRGAQESCRAITVGRRVAEEVRSSNSARLLTVPTRDRYRESLDRADARVSSDGRFVVFTSRVPLIAGGRTTGRNAYVLDVATGRIEPAVHDPGWMSRVIDVQHPSISRDGRLLAVEAYGAGEARVSHAGWRLLVIERHGNGDELWSRSSSATRREAAAEISADGSALVFESTPRSGPLASSTEIHLARLPSGLTERIDIESSCAQPRTPQTRPRPPRDSARSMGPVVSADGRFVAFTSTRDLTCDGAARANVYVRDTAAGTTVRVSRRTDGDEPNGDSYGPAISADGRVVAFTSEASDLTRGDRNRAADVFMHDLVTKQTTLVSRRPSGQSASAASRAPALSGDGCTVAFQSLASDLTCSGRCAPDDADINGLWDVFVYAAGSGTVVRASGSDGSAWMASSHGPSLDHHGRVLAFWSRQPTDSGDVQNDDDVFVRLVPGAAGAEGSGRCLSSQVRNSRTAGG